ncbi:hypothetical protein BDK92_7284 [Micromonospora pisi]|uniref:Uncharacterized protein n=1 Tax=Micromonospora pisi TaxID=589240 RepID=A0A495JWS0_9ACTN|nr:DUF6221 family protein [Micromonospora pisi]RKR92802.1 hypothetical protein BDK92_7284 [Micromonospora pisi]
MTEPRITWLLAQIDRDERKALAASGGTVVGEAGYWRPSPAGDEWEALRDVNGDEELLVALRPDLPRPPDVLGGHWGVVVTYYPDDNYAGAPSPIPAFEHAANQDPRRTLSEVAFKREIIAKYEGALQAVQQHPNDDLHRVAAAVLSRVVTALAPVYSARTGYTEHWGEQ